jgi:hypothetical protein
MKRIAWAAAGFAAIGLISTAAYAQPPRVEGQNCSALIAKIGPAKTWRTTFWGQRRNTFDRYDDYSATYCFTSEKQCKAWLYWIQTDWPHRNNFVPCRPVGR